MVIVLEQSTLSYEYYVPAPEYLKVHQYLSDG